MTHVTQYVLTHGALVLFAWILAQQAGAPIPGAPLLVVVGSLASSGRVNVVSVLAASFGACLAADGFWYHVGRSGWSISNYVRPRTSGRTSRVLRILTEHALGALLPAKFISCSNVAALVAGKTGIALQRFLIFDSIASFFWAGGYIAIGYFIGNRVEVAVRYASAPLLVLLGLVVVWFLTKLMWRERRLRLHGIVLSILTLLSCSAELAPAQSSIGAAGATSYATTPSSSLGQGPLIGSVPTGSATDEVLRLTLREAIDRALKYNLGSIEGGENTHLARGQQLIALSQFLAQIRLRSAFPTSVSRAVKETCLLDEVEMSLIGRSLDPASISALAAILGSLTGALASSASTCITQRHQDRRDILAKRLFYREQLYSDFFGESARAMADAIQHDFQDANTIVPTYVFLSRIRLSSSSDVLESAKCVVQHIISNYSKPNLTPEQIQSGASNREDLLREFSHICRAELEGMQRPLR